MQKWKKGRKEQLVNENKKENRKNEDSNKKMKQKTHKKNTEIKRCGNL